MFSSIKSDTFPEAIIIVTGTVFSLEQCYSYTNQYLNKKALQLVPPRDSNCGPTRPQARVLKLNHNDPLI
jgi:hypothetical protein